MYVMFNKQQNREMDFSLFIYRNGKNPFPQFNSVQSHLFLQITMASRSKASDEATDLIEEDSQAQKTVTSYVEKGVSVSYSSGVEN
jgi:hypothetical protein